MKKLLLALILLFACISLISCGALEALAYSVSGAIIDPVGDFSRGSDDGTFVWGGNNYILIDEFNGCFGSFDFDIIEGDVYLGQTSNFPFFPNSSYYANASESADYIMGTNSSEYATCVYLREDLYQEPFRYVMRDAEYEFDFSSAFIKTDEVGYAKHLEGREYRGSRIYFHVKDHPRLAAEIVLCQINEKWYYVKYDEAFALSEEFLSVLEKNNLLN